MQKLDSRLRHLLRQRVPESSELAERVGVAMRATPPPNVEVLIRCAAGTSPADVAAAGVQPRFFASGPSSLVVSGEASLDALPGLQRVPFVERVEASRSMVLDLDRSRVESGAAALHAAAPPVRGADVIVGIVDGGIDYTHDDFRNPDGTSRILFLWDQGGAGGAPGAVPFGREFTKADLDAALGSANPLAQAPHQDPGAHGTHVAGIAAGNGRAGAAFRGVAPDADLIIVALRSEAGVTLGRSVRAFDAFTYIVQRANGQPLAINMSQGMNGGGHSGETVLETGLDNLVRQPNVVVVKSAGNEQEWRIHAGGSITTGQTVALELQVQTNDRLDDVVELWHDGRDQIAVALQPPGGAALPFVLPGGQGSFDTPAGNRVSIDSDLDADDTGDSLATIILSQGSASFIQPGTWRLLLRGDNVQNGRYDAWIERTSRGGGGREQTRFTAASTDSTRTISVPGTARRIITVGAYVTRATPGSGASLGAISTFSSRGPTRYGLQKPEIAAPGEVIISARSSQSQEPPDPDAEHTGMPGTSMAAPHVAGAAALLLGVRPGLTCEQVKQILMQTAKRDGQAAVAPDNTWGAGKLNVAAAVERAPAVQFATIQNVTVAGTSLSWQTNIPATGAVRFHTNRRHLQLLKSPGSKADLVLGLNHTVDLSGLPAGTYFCEVLAFTPDNFWTEEDNGGAYFVVVVP